MSEGQPFDLPDRIEPGEFELAFMYDEATGKPEAMKIQFTWVEDTTATFRYDAWESPDDPSFVFEINSSPVYGWASWINGEDVLIAFTCPDAEEEGWARIPGGAPVGD
jgi:hypothetical protein